MKAIINIFCVLFLFLSLEQALAGSKDSDWSGIMIVGENHTADEDNQELKKTLTEAAKDGKIYLALEGYPYGIIDSENPRVFGIESELPHDVVMAIKSYVMLFRSLHKLHGEGDSNRKQSNLAEFLAQFIESTSLTKEVWQEKVPRPFKKNKQEIVALNIDKLLSNQEGRDFSTGIAYFREALYESDHNKAHFKSIVRVAKVFAIETVKHLNQTGGGQALSFEKGAALDVFPFYNVDMKHEFSNKTSITPQQLMGVDTKVIYNFLENPESIKKETVFTDQIAVGWRDNFLSQNILNIYNDFVKKEETLLVIIVGSRHVWTLKKILKQSLNDNTPITVTGQKPEQDKTQQHTAELVIPEAKVPADTLSERQAGPTELDLGPKVPADADKAKTLKVAQSAIRSVLSEERQNEYKEKAFREIASLGFMLYNGGGGDSAYKFLTGPLTKIDNLLQADTFSSEEKEQIRSLSRQYIFPEDLQTALIRILYRHGEGSGLSQIVNSYGGLHYIYDTFFRLSKIGILQESLQEEVFGMLLDYVIRIGPSQQTGVEQIESAGRAELPLKRDLSRGEPLLLENEKGATSFGTFPPSRKDTKYESSIHSTASQRTLNASQTTEVGMLIEQDSEQAMSLNPIKAMFSRIAKTVIPERGLVPATTISPTSIEHHGLVIPNRGPPPGGRRFFEGKLYWVHDYETYGFLIKELNYMESVLSSPLYSETEKKALRSFWRKGIFSHTLQESLYFYAFQSGAGALNPKRLRVQNIVKRLKKMGLWTETPDSNLTLGVYGETKETKEKKETRERMSCYRAFS